MKQARAVLLTALLLCSAGTVYGGGAREAKHLILPVLGYQSLNGEQIGVDYTAWIYLQLFDSTIVVNSSRRSERDARAPMFGLLYRYSPNRQYFGEVTIGVIHDKTTFGYKVEIPVYNFTSVVNTSVSRSNTTILNLDGGYRFQLPVKWVEPAARLGVGYAWRSVKFISPDDPSNTFQITSRIHDAANMLAARAGLDVTLWKESALVATGSLYYQQFYPSGVNTDPFGGFGWRMSFFPVWRD
jgi:hypothetical protein